MRLFYENGYEKTSIRDIAKSLELPNSALYYYFQNKQDMLFTIIDDMMEKTLQTLRERTKDLKGPELKLSLIIDNHIRLYVEHRFQMKVLLHEVNSLEGEYSKIIKEKEREYVNYLKDVLREIIKKYGYKIDLNVATFCLFGMVKLDLRLV